MWINNSPATPKFFRIIITFIPVLGQWPPKTNCLEGCRRRTCGAISPCVCPDKKAGRYCHGRCLCLGGSIVDITYRRSHWHHDLNVEFLNYITDFKSAELKKACNCRPTWSQSNSGQSLKFIFTLFNRLYQILTVDIQCKDHIRCYIYR